MSLTGTVPTHPARFTPAILQAIEPTLARLGLPVHDPFAGEGRRLGALCDRLGLTFTGADIEAWPERDERVAVADSRDAASYPDGPFVVVTSPPYFGNRISTDYANGPTPTTKTAGRHSYGISLGRGLADANLARLCRPTRQAEHDAFAAAIVQWWPQHVIVNVDSPIAEQWEAILASAGYTIVQRLDIVTPRLGGGLAGATKRASAERILLAERAPS